MRKTTHKHKIKTAATEAVVGAVEPIKTSIVKKVTAVIVAGATLVAASFGQTILAALTAFAVGNPIVASIIFGIIGTAALAVLTYGAVKVYKNYFRSKSISQKLLLKLESTLDKESKKALKRISPDTKAGAKALKAVTKRLNDLKAQRSKSIGVDMSLFGKKEDDDDTNRQKSNRIYLLKIGRTFQDGTISDLFSKEERRVVAKFAESTTISKKDLVTPKEDADFFENVTPIAQSERDTLMRALNRFYDVNDELENTEVPEILKGEDAAKNLLNLAKIALNELIVGECINDIGRILTTENKHIAPKIIEEAQKLTNTLSSSYKGFGRARDLYRIFYKTSSPTDAQISQLFTVLSAASSFEISNCLSSKGNMPTSLEMTVAIGKFSHELEFSESINLVEQLHVLTDALENSPMLLRPQNVHAVSSKEIQVTTSNTQANALDSDPLLIVSQNAQPASSQEIQAATRKTTKLDDGYSSDSENNDAILSAGSPRNTI
jgi:hypothetical protein